MSNSLRPHGLYSPWNSLGQNTGVGSLSFLQEIFPTQGSNPGLPHCRQILTSWITREAQKYWSGYLSFLQGIFPTQESNWGLLHYKRILYQLSYQGSHWKWFQAENKNLYSVNHVYLQSQEIHLNRWIRQILFILSNDGSKEQTQYIWYAI